MTVSQKRVSLKKAKESREDEGQGTIKGTEEKKTNVKQLRFQKLFHIYTHMCEMTYI